LDRWQGSEPVDLAWVQQSDKLARELAQRQVEATRR